MIEFGAMEHEKDKENWRGRPHDLYCVARGTLIRMASGRQQPVESIQCGDMVATLEGPRPVTKKHSPRIERCVRLDIFDENGKRISSQIQSSWHKILTSSGWISFDMVQQGLGSDCTRSQRRDQELLQLRSSCLSLAEPLPLSFSSYECRVLDRSCASRLFCSVSSREYCASGTNATQRLDSGRFQLKSLPCLRQGYQPGESLFRSTADRQSRREISSCTAEQGQGIAGAGSYARNAETSRRILCFSSDARRLAPFLPSGEQDSFRHSPDRASCDAQCSSLFPGFQERCSCGRDPCGELLRSGDVLCSRLDGAAALVCLPQRVGAVLPIPTDFADDDRGRTRKRNQSTTSYVHPYTKEIRRTLEPVACFSWSMVPVGEREVYDFSVGELNHYISESGIVNKNCFDEVTQMTETQFRFVKAWCRSTLPGQRCRIVATGNPPTSVEGEWVIRYWAPWLDSQHPHPAAPGELRWFAQIKDSKGATVEKEFLTGDSVHDPERPGQWLKPRSRTFIPALLKDNPILEKTGYISEIQALPEPLRTQALYGDFTIGLQDDAWQVIPTAWVRAAQKRWHPDGWKQFLLSALGVDVAYGGADDTVIVRRHGTWFGVPVVYSGPQATAKQAGEGEAAAALVMREHRDKAEINIDAIGYGAAAYESLKRYPLAHRIHIRGVNAAAASGIYDKSGKFPLTNVRAALYWRFREALDPVSGENLALPPDRLLEADLCSARYELSPGGIRIEAKDDIKERIGRSPDRGDACVLALWYNRGPGIPDPKILEKIEKEMELLYNRHEPPAADIDGLTPDEIERGGQRNGYDPATGDDEGQQQPHHRRRKWCGG